MKDVIYSCDYCKNALNGIAVGTVYLSKEKDKLREIAGMLLDEEVEVSRAVAVREYDTCRELFCNWSCHMKRMDLKFPTVDTSKIKVLIDSFVEDIGKKALSSE